MIRFDLLTATLEERDQLIEFIGPQLSLQSLIELNLFANKHGLGQGLFDVEEFIYGKRKDDNTEIPEFPSMSTWVISKDLTLQTENSGLGEVFMYDGVREEILGKLDWTTLWYSIPYVNKMLGSRLSRKFVIQNCGDLKEYLKKEAKVFKLEYLYNMRRPWNSLFPSVHHLVKFYVDNLYDADMPNAWWRKVIDGIGLFEYNDDIIAKSMEARGKMYIRKDLPLKHHLRVTNIFLKNPDAYNAAILDNIDGKLMIQLIGEVDKPMELFQHFHNRIIHGQSSDIHAIGKFLGAILLPDTLDWPVEVKEMAEILMNEHFGFAVKLPFTAEVIRKLEAEQLRVLTCMFYSDNMQVPNKLFAALSDSDAAIWKDFAGILGEIDRRPMSMTPEQFEVFIRRAIELKGGDEEFQRALSKFYSSIRDKVASLYAEQ